MMQATFCIMHQNLSPTLLTKQQVADRLQISLRTLERWKDQGILVPVEFPGRNVRYRVKDVDALAADAS